MKRRTYKVEVVKNRTTPFLVRYPENGKRVYNYFKTRSEAECFVASLKRFDVMPNCFDFSAKGVFLHSQFKDLVETLNIDLKKAYEEAGEFLAKKYAPIHSGLTLDEAFRAFLKSRIKRNDRNRSTEEYEGYFAILAEGKYDKDKKCRVGGIGRDYLIERLTSEDLKDIIAKSSAFDSVREKFTSKLKTFFAWLHKRELISYAPAAKLESGHKKKDKEPIQILNPAQTREMFKKLPLNTSVLASYALLAFAGLRPEEVCSKDFSKKIISWEDIDMNSKQIFIGGKSTKTRNPRHLSDLRPNIWEFLELTPPKERKGAVCKLPYGTMVKIHRAVKSQYVQDVLRKTFASYGYYEYGSDRIIHLMGHRGGDKLFKEHYLGFSSPSSAKEYFAITPESLGIKLNGESLNSLNG